MSTQHGTPSTYRNGGCRCTACKEAQRMCARESRKRWHAEMVAGTRKVRHGERSTYCNYACRCEPCRAASSMYMARRAQATR